MKKSWFLHLTLLVSCLFPGIALLAQPGFPPPFEGGRDVVIAPSGLNLRAAPSADGEKLLTVPYLSRVELLEDESAGADTIGRVEREPIAGHWVRASYGGKSGYLFDAYLMSHYQVGTAYQDSSYFVVSPGMNCGDMFYDLTKYHQYGVYGTGAATRLVPLRGHYVMLPLVIDGPAPHYVPDVQSEDLRYVIASRTPLNAKQIRFRATAADFDGEIDRVEAAAAGLLIGEDTVPVSIGSADSTSVQTATLRRGSLTQRLEESHLSGVQLLGYGDLDGDGHTDYLLQLHEDMISYRRLYLSGAARPGEVARPVGLEEFGPCC